MSLNLACARLNLLTRLKSLTRLKFTRTPKFKPKFKLCVLEFKFEFKAKFKLNPQI